jgi:hypothetical protein
MVAMMVVVIMLTVRVVMIVLVAVRLGLSVVVRLWVVVASRAGHGAILRSCTAGAWCGAQDAMAGA